MRKIANWLGVLSILFFYCGCSKDNNSNTALSGNWSFQGFHATTYSSQQDTESGSVFKTVTTSDYTTTANGGTVNISGGIMAGSGLAYTANINAFTTEYQDDQILDTFSSSIPVTIPPTNSSSTFEQIGTDSIHYTSSSLIGSASGSPAANGAKFSIAEGILTLTSNVVVDRVVDTLGTVLTQHETATVVTTLKKQ